MTTIIIKQEYEFLKKDLRLRWSVVICFLLFSAGLLIGITYYKINSKINSKAQLDTYNQWLNQGEKNPHSAAHYGLYAYKPVPLLSIIDKGMDEYLGSAVWLEAHNQNEVKLKYMQDAGSLGRFNFLTVGFVWQYLLPLIILLLSFNSVSKEYESGRLKVLLSTNITALEFLFSKVISILKSVLVWMFFPMILICTVLVFFTGNLSEFKTCLASLCVMCVFYVLYYFLFVMLGVFVSATLKSSSLSLLVLLGFWVIGGFLITRISGNLTKIIEPTPTSLQFTETVLKEREYGVDGKSSYELFQKNVRENALKKYNVDSVSQLPVSFAGLALKAGEERDWKVYDKYYGNLFNIFRAQDKWLECFNILSPTLSMRNLSRSLSSTDMNKHIDFTNKAEAHRRIIAELMNDDQIKNGVGKERGYKSNNTLWRQVPQFYYTQPNILFMLKTQILSIITLLFWTALMMCLMWRSSKKLSPI